ncbi:MAG: hypothetical protein AAF456_09085 [Planctomycetota bacterium]
MTTTYENYGLKFMYPENWSLSEPSADELPRQVTLETPDGGIWSLSIFPATSDSDDLLKDAVAALEETYDEVEVSAADSDFEPFKSRGVDAFFYCLDFVVSARIRVFSLEEQKLVVLYQAESREFDKQIDVFRAMTLNMLQST